jgi:hypothetical protein
MIALSVQLLLNIIPALIGLAYVAINLSERFGDSKEFKRSLLNQNVLRRRTA